MKRNQVTLLGALLLFMVASPLWAQFASDPVPTSTPQPSSSSSGYEKPAAAEREFFGYDPEGVEYRENRVEDFQVIFIETAPFAALLSFGTSALVSVISRGKVSVSGGYLVGATMGTVLLSGTVAYVSIKGKPYPPPDSLAMDSPQPLRLAFRVPLVQMRF
jgi:hypothetical protein